MNNKFDELTKSMAQSVTRREALKKFGVGLAGLALACFGLANSAKGATTSAKDADCKSGKICCNGACVALIPDWCDQTNNECCCTCTGKGRKAHLVTGLPVCHPAYYNCVNICGYAGFINPKACE